MKKILFILPSLVIGGMERVQVTIANKLSDAGYDVTVMTFDEGEELRCELSDKVRYIHKEPKPFKIMRKIPYIRYKYYDNGLWETRASAKKLYHYYVGNEHYDVEIAFFRGRAVKIVSGSTNKESKKIAWVHSDFSKASGYLANFKILQDTIFAYKKMDHVICVSEQACEGFKEIIGDTGNLKTIYNILSVKDILQKSDDKPQIGVIKKRFHVVLVGRLLDSVKGQKRAIDAVSKLHDEGRDISLAIIGGGSDEAALKEYVHQISANGFISFTGNQMNPFPYIKEADLLLCTSYFEGYNLTVAEALMLGTPVLSTNCTGPNEILDHGKFGLIVENSEEGLYNGLRSLVDDPDLLKEYREKTIQRQGFFNEDRILDQILSLF